MSLIMSKTLYLIRNNITLQNLVNINIRIMEKAYNITDIRFENNYLILRVDNQLIKLNLTDISEKLVNATNSERKDFKISPSGYGIHWRQLDEDLSINGMLKSIKKTRSTPSTPV
jgi:hypothetical protein